MVFGKLQDKLHKYYVNLKNWVIISANNNDGNTNEEEDIDVTNDKTKNDTNNETNNNNNNMNNIEEFSDSTNNNAQQTMFHIFANINVQCKKILKIDLTIRLKPEFHRQAQFYVELRVLRFNFFYG